MGEAKRRRAAKPATVYHHTSVLRTNLLWMSGVVEVEGKGQAPIHPQLGEVHSNPAFRRAMKDFPAVCWFTLEISVPKCLTTHNLYLAPRDGGTPIEMRLSEEMSNAISMTRVALGFQIQSLPLIAWPEYRGFSTDEGRELNRTALECGDNPKHWYVSESAIDLADMTEIWVQDKGRGAKLKRQDAYLASLRPIIERCKADKSVFIPPTWIKENDARQLARSLGVPIGEI